MLLGDDVLFAYSTSDWLTDLAYWIVTWFTSIKVRIFRRLRATDNKTSRGFSASDPVYGMLWVISYKINPMFTFFDVYLDFTKVEIVDVVRCDPLDADKSSPDRVRAPDVGRSWWHDWTWMIAAETVKRRIGVTHSHFNVTNTTRWLTATNVSYNSLVNSLTPAVDTCRCTHMATVGVKGLIRKIHRTACVKTSRYTARWPLRHVARTDNYWLQIITKNEAFSLVNVFNPLTPTVAMSPYGYSYRASCAKLG